MKSFCWTCLFVSLDWMPVYNLVLEWRFYEMDFRDFLHYKLKDIEFLIKFNFSYGTVALVQ